MIHLSPGDSPVSRSERGFGFLIERERSLRLFITVLESSAATHTLATSRILRSQLRRVMDNIALLEHRYDYSLVAENFISWPPISADQGGQQIVPLSVLRQLIGHHLAIVTLVQAQALEDRSVKEILTQIVRSHQEMAWILVALLKAEAGEPLRSLDRSVEPAAGG